MITDVVPGTLPAQELGMIVESWFGLKLTEQQKEDHVRPASFDTLIGHRAWRLSKNAGWFRPPVGVTVEEYLRHVPKDDIKYFGDISNGLELAPGYIYVCELQGYYSIPKNFFIRASPKSTQGRLGNLVRLIGDCRPDFDHIYGPFEGRLYVLVEPGAFRCKARPGTALNQIRGSCRNTGRLTGDELVRRYNSTKFITVDQKPVPIESIAIQLFESGLIPLTLDLHCQENDGIIGFKAKNTPDLIDLDVKDLLWEEFFTPLIAPRYGQLSIDPEDKLLILTTREQMDVPIDICLEMESVSSRSGNKRWHKAGFIDPTFRGNVVLEVDSLETVMSTLTHGMSVGGLEVLELREPTTKPYKDSGNYHNQFGPRLAKHFSAPPLIEIAHELDKSKMPIMAIPRDSLFEGNVFEGFAPPERDMFSAYLQKYAEHGEWHPRGVLEDDPAFKQPIGYVAIVCKNTKRIFVYERSTEKQAYHEQRLGGLWSIGVGGHVRMKDNRDNKAIENSTVRELMEEVTFDSAPELVHLGYLNDESNDVNRVHFGIAYVVEVDDEDQVRARETSLKEYSWLSIKELKKLNLEHWSTHLLPALQKYLS